MALNTKIAFKVDGTRSDTLDLGSQKALHSLEDALTWVTGTGESKADEVWSDTRTVNSGANDDLELDNLSQLDSSGSTLRTVAFDKVKLIAIKNTSSADRLEIGGVGATAFAGAGYPLKDDSDIACLPFGGLWLWHEPTGVAVTNGATDVLRVSGITSNQTYKIIIIGEST